MQTRFARASTLASLPCKGSESTMHKSISKHECNQINLTRVRRALRHVRRKCTSPGRRACTWRGAPGPGPAAYLPEPPDSKRPKHTLSTAGMHDHTPPHGEPPAPGDLPTSSCRSPHGPHGGGLRRASPGPGRPTPGHGRRQGTPRPSDRRTHARPGALRPPHAAPQRPRPHGPDGPALTGKFIEHGSPPTPRQTDPQQKTHTESQKTPKNGTTRCMDHPRARTMQPTPRGVKGVTRPGESTNRGPQKGARPR